MRSLFTNSDKVIFLVNKIDECRLFCHNPFNKRLLCKEAQIQYEGLFKNFMKTGILHFIRPYNFDIEPFSSGLFPNFRDKDVYPSTQWEMGNNSYCQNLWSSIKKYL